MLLLGAHVPTSGGVSKAPLNGQALGCTAIQIFTKNQMQWSAAPFTDEEVLAYFENLEKSGIKSVVSHDSYLINLASPEAAKREQSLTAFIDEIRRADRLKLDGLVFHPGSHMGAGEAQGIALLVETLNQATETAADSRVRLLIEGMSGQGTNLGYKFEHLRDILGGVRRKDRFGICIDTCHLFGAGHSIATKEEYAETFRALDQIVGLEEVRCIHLNDSKHPKGSRKDRHEHIGLGLIGKAGFGLLLRDPRFAKVPKVIETEDVDDWHSKDLKSLRALIKKKA
jgi:deoxyribonuclease IV